ncbi:MAG: hypothetical protein H0T18_00835 [Chloroflexia bacterium]|nr:hypothetical protein [Chloroflexia bacterium]
MPQKIVKPTELSRRAVIRASVGSAVLALGRSTTAISAAQSVDTTPVSDRQERDAEASPLPGGITLADGEVSEGVVPKPGGALKIVRPGKSVANFNPAAFAQDSQIPLSYLEPLVRADPQTMRPVPWLASNWEWRENGRSLAMGITSGTLWHDGSPLSASDAAFSFQVYWEDSDSAVAGLFALVEAVEIVSDLEILVRFRERDANWLFNAATLPILSHKQYAYFWDEQPANARTLSGFDWSESLPIGTGPWRVAEWDEGRVRFERSESYWREVAWFDTLDVAVEVSKRNRLDAWMAGDSHLAWPVRVGDLDALAGEKGTLYSAPAASVMFAAFNFTNPEQPSGSLWSDLRVRRAASLAIDRERYATEVFGGFLRWDAAGTIGQPWANDASLLTPVYDPETASVLLAEAGWIDYDGDGVLEDVNGWPLRPVAILRDDSRPELAAVLARVARDLATVGIGLSIESLDADAFAQRWISARTYDLIAYAYDQLPGFTDYDLYGSAWDIRSNAAGWNPGGYANQHADDAIDEFFAAISIERQKTALQRLQRAVDDDLFGLWFGFPQDLVLVADDVAGFQPDMAWQTAQSWALWQTRAPS